jgi:eukaryotic-like serine/threonine-protein kinase
VHVDMAPAAPLSALPFRAGDPVPQRPQWRLAEHLGTGGHGEAWLARHEKTGEQRVFKFALDAGALDSLKREITLYRVLQNAAGQRAAVVPVLEWNVEEPPYFMETAFIGGRDLGAWAATRGGLAAMPLGRRLELVAQVAEALGAAHSIGVLHKDLKPANVLVEERADGTPRILLCDFGSGGIIDTDRLDALGITNLGFTKTAAADEGAHATPLYVAPEIMSGQPFTVGADIYALGVMLYQLVIGDLRRPLAPGWEFNVPDPLLREDIAATAAGDPSRRLADATQLALRLRSLDERHRLRAAQAAAQEKAERAQRVLLALRRTRAFAAAVLLLAVAAIAGVVTAHRARNDAIEARATTQAINDFLTEGVLSVDPAAEKPIDASYESLLNRAASQVDARFANRPEAAASIHWLLGQRFHEVGHVDEARIQYERAAADLPSLTARQSIPALLSIDRLIPIYVERGRIAEGLALSDKLLAGWKREYGESDLSTLLIRARVARHSSHAGELNKADAEFRAALAKLPEAPPPSESAKALLKVFLGWILAADTSRLLTDEEVTSVVAAYIKSSYAGHLSDMAEDYLQSVSTYREVLPTLSKLMRSDSEETADAQMGLGLGLALLGHFDEGADYIANAEQFFDSSLPPSHWLRVPSRLIRGRLELERRRPKQAMSALTEALRLCSEGCSPRLVEEIRYELARSYEQLGDIDRAIGAYRQTIDAFDQLRGPNHIGSLKRRLSLADALRRTNRPIESAAVLAKIDAGALDALPAPHLVVAEHKRIQALLVLDADPERARSHLEQSLNIVEFRLGKTHARSARARAELSAAIQRMGSLGKAKGTNDRT